MQRVCGVAGGKKMSSFERGVKLRHVWGFFFAYWFGNIFAGSNSLVIVGYAICCMLLVVYLWLFQIREDHSWPLGEKKIKLRFPFWLKHD